MKKKLKLFGYFLLIILVLIQFYPSEKPSVSFHNPNDLTITEKVPNDIALKIKAACYDCHSNESKFPWYSNVAPTKWLVNNHIIEGREELNFSEWNAIETDDKSDLLDDISSLVSDGEMPIKGYTLLHSEAKLSEADREAITNWADDMLDSLYE